MIQKLDRSLAFHQEQDKSRENSVAKILTGQHTGEEHRSQQFMIVDKN